MSIYVPQGCKPLSELTDGQIRLGIQGPPFSGKTSASLTFPNPVAGSLDRKLTAHNHRADVINVPFYDPEFIYKYFPKQSGKQPNTAYAILKWLQTEGLKLTAQQTFIADNSTGIEEAYHRWYGDNKVYTKQMEEDQYAQWRIKVDYFGDLFTAFKALSCNVVYLCHETDDRGKNGDLNGQIRPLLTGQVADKLGGNFSDWFAAVVVGKPLNKEEEKKLMDWAKIDSSTLQEWVNSTPSDCQAIYLWQTQPDKLRTMLGSTSLIGQPKYIIAHYNSFLKYKRKGSEQTTK